MDNCPRSWGPGHQSLPAVLARPFHLQAAGSKGTQQPPAAGPGGLLGARPLSFSQAECSVLSAQVSFSLLPQARDLSGPSPAG